MPDVIVERRTVPVEVHSGNVPPGFVAATQAAIAGLREQVGGGGISDPIAARDAVNLARANALQSRRITGVQRATCAYNAMIVHGQSLAVGQETWPPLSTAARFGSKMLGDVVHSRNSTAAEEGAQYDYTVLYYPFGDDVFRDLRSVATDGLRRKLLTPAEVSALPAGDAAYGEVPAIGLVNAAKFLHNQELRVANDDSRTFVGASVGLSGNAIETFTRDGRFFKDGQPANSFFTFWYRFPDLVAKLKAAAAGKSICATAMLWMQGENNAVPGFDGASSLKVDYRLNLGKVIDDHQQTVRDTFPDQVAPFAFLTYQTGGSYARDKDGAGTPGLAVAMAQLEVTNERPDAWMVGPVYPYTDKGGHLDSNGSRWFAEQVAKVHNRIVTQGLDWSPLQPTRITREARTVLIDYHVPCPPLAFERPYVVNVATEIPDRGFRVTDGMNRDVPVTSVAIVGDTIVRLTLAHEPQGDAHVWYASQAHGGAGMLRDSDPAVSLTRYEYLPGAGMYASADIAALKDKPYPLWNWGVAFHLPIGFGA